MRSMADRSASSQDGLAVADREALEDQGRGRPEQLIEQAQRGCLAHAPGGEVAAGRLIAEDLLAFEHEHVVVVAGQHGGQRCACDAPSDDDDVVSVHPQCLPRRPPLRRR